VNNPDGGVLSGTPSEAISEDGRLLAGIGCEPGDVKTITVTAAGLPAPLSHVNACRVVFPASYDYVPDSFNVGAVGGNTNTRDGIWAFARGMLLGDDAWFAPVELGHGLRAIDFNVTSIAGETKAAPVGYGDLFNFKLKSTGSEPLSLRFELGDPTGIKRLYFSEDRNDGTSTEHYFGNSIGFKVN
jgi:hypothetical protein